MGRWRLGVDDSGRGFADDAADDYGAFVHAGEGEAGFLEQVGGNDRDQADAHIEGAEHLVGVQASEGLQVGEERRRVPGGEVDVRGEAAGENAGEVFGEAAAGDVSEAADDLCLNELADGGEIAAMRTHEGGADFIAELIDVLLGAIAGGAEEELEGEGVAGGVEAGGGEAEEVIAFADGFAGEHAGAADDSGEEAC